MTTATYMPHVAAMFDGTNLQDDFPIHLSSLIIEPNRLNLALTRASHGVIVLGCIQSLIHYETPPVGPEEESGIVLKALVAFHGKRGSLGKSDRMDENPRIKQVLSPRLVKKWKGEMAAYKPTKALNWLLERSKQVPAQRRQELENRSRSFGQMVVYNANSRAFSRIAPGQLAEEAEGRLAQEVPWTTGGKKAAKKKQFKGQEMETGPSTSEKRSASDQEDDHDPKRLH